VPPTSTAIGKSPHTSSPGRGRRAAAHSIGPIHPFLRTWRDPFPHSTTVPLPGADPRSTGPSIVAHQAGRGQARGPSSSRPRARARCRRCRAVVLGADHQACRPSRY
jgi:hypothetical protein